MDFTPEYVIKALREIGGDQSELGQYAADSSGKAMSRTQVHQLLKYRVFPAKAEVRVKQALMMMLQAKEAELSQKLRRCKKHLGRIAQMTEQ